MRIFITGATGYIGTAVLEALLRAGHEVAALVRDRGSARELAAKGAQPVVGDLGEPGSYKEAAAERDGIIHAAFEASPRGPDLDGVAVETFIAAAGQPRAGASTASRFFVYTSGVWVLGDTREPATEASALAPAEAVSWRPLHERRVLEADREDLRTIVVRPGIVYGRGRGIVGDLIRDATNGLVRVVGRGENHWPLVYDRDLADLYLRLATRADARGVYHANDEGDERVNDVVDAIASHVAGRPDVRHVPLEQARAQLGPYADALALDQVVRSPRARAIGWAPVLRSVSGSIARLLDEWRAAREAAAR